MRCCLQLPGNISDDSVSLVSNEVNMCSICCASGYCADGNSRDRTQTASAAGCREGKVSTDGVATASRTVALRCVCSELVRDGALPARSALPVHASWPALPRPACLAVCVWLQQERDTSMEQGRVSAASAEAVRSAVAVATIREDRAVERVQNCTLEGVHQHFHHQ